MCYESLKLSEYQYCIKVEKPELLQINCYFIASLQML